MPGKVTSGKIDETGVDTEPLLMKIQKAKADAGNHNFRWSNQNDAAEVLGVIFTGLTKTFVHWDVSSVKVRAYSKCIECSHKWHGQTAVQPCLILASRLLFAMTVGQSKRVTTSLTASVAKPGTGLVMRKWPH